MKATIREMRRAPLRVAMSIFTIALAMAAIGVFAVPGVSRNSLRDIAEQDQLAHLTLSTTPIADADALEALGPEITVQVRVTGTVAIEGRNDLRVVSYDPSGVIDTVRLDTGRLPATNDEVVLSPGLGVVGDVITLAGSRALTVVGIGETTALATDDVAYVNVETAQALTHTHGYNQVVARLEDPTADRLDAAVESLRGVLAPQGVAFTEFPVTLPNGAHPIESDIEQISVMLGGLGIVAGIVALILLASTSNAIVAQRSRDAAVMMAVGGSRREVRRELRRLALVIGAAGTVVGIPLGIGVANVVARMVLQRFAGISPGFGVAIPAIAASAVFGLVGPRLVSGRAARRVCNVELVTALRDRDGVPFGRRWSDRALARVQTGGLSQRIALRGIARRKGRALAITAQLASAVAAAVLVASLATSLNAFNKAELADYRWEGQTTPADARSPYPLDSVFTNESTATSEIAVFANGKVEDWEVEVIGVRPDTQMVGTGVTSGSWISTPVPTGEPTPVVLAQRFATQEGFAVGDDLVVQLASGPHTYRIVGLHGIHSVAMFVPSAELARDLGTPGYGNVVWTRGAGQAPDLDGMATTFVTPDELFAEDVAARDAILAIFAAIGLIVVSVAAMGAASTVAMNLLERRNEMATLGATGATRRDLRRLVAMELTALASVGWAVGVWAGFAGAKVIMDVNEQANAIDIGFARAWTAVPLSALGLGFLIVLLAAHGARQIQRRPLAATLRATS